MKQAIIDIGSNSIRLTLYETEGQSFKILFREKIMAGLAGYVEDGKLSAEGIHTLVPGLLILQHVFHLFHAEQLVVGKYGVREGYLCQRMPDYSIIQTLCDALHVTLPELMDGEDAADSSVRVYDDTQILDLLRRTQELERQKGSLYGLVLIVLGIACGAMSKTTGGTDVQDFVSGILMGLSVAEILAGILIAGKRLLSK